MVEYTCIKFWNACIYAICMCKSLGYYLHCFFSNKFFSLTLQGIQGLDKEKEGQSTTNMDK